MLKANGSSYFSQVARALPMEQEDLNSVLVCEVQKTETMTVAKPLVNFHVSTAVTQFNPEPVPARYVTLKKQYLQKYSNYYFKG